MVHIKASWKEILQVLWNLWIGARGHLEVLFKVGERALVRGKHVHEAGIQPRFAQDGHQVVHALRRQEVLQAFAHGMSAPGLPLPPQLSSLAGTLRSLATETLPSGGLLKRNISWAHISLHFSVCALCHAHRLCLCGVIMNITQGVRAHDEAEEGKSKCIAQCSKEFKFWWAI